jgi:hypothetical protein
MPAISPADALRGCAVAAQVNRLARIEHDALVLPVIRALQKQDKSLTEIGHELYARGYAPRRGTYWHKRQLLRILQRDRKSETPHEGAASEAATNPVEEATEPVTVPEPETALAVTLPVEMHHHGAQRAVTEPSSETPYAGTAGDASGESIAMGVSHLPAWLEREMQHHNQAAG